MVRLGVLLVVLGMPAVAAAQPIESGSIPHPSTSVQWGRASTVLDASMEEVMAVITDYGHYNTFMPQVTTSRVLQQRGANATLYLQAQAVGGNLTLWAQLSCFARHPRGDTQIIEAQLVEGNLERFTARWEVTPAAEGKSQVVLSLIAEPDLPLPAFIVSQNNVDAARWAVQSLRRRVRQVARAARAAEPAHADNVCHPDADVPGDRLVCLGPEHLAARRRPGAGPA